jgi:sporulation protein YlmC with PRC-barrel domain
VLSASTIIGDHVRNPEGEDLGKIEELMIDVKAGRIAYAVLSFGGILGLGDKFFAIPWETLSLRPREKEFVLNIDKEKLKEAPGFDKNDWPMTGDVEWTEEDEAAVSRLSSYSGPACAIEEKREREVTIPEERVQAETVVVEEHRKVSEWETTHGRAAAAGTAAGIAAGKEKPKGRPATETQTSVKKERTAKEIREACHYDRERASKDYNCEWLEGMYITFGYRPYWYEEERTSPP